MNYAQNKLLNKPGFYSTAAVAGRLDYDPEKVTLDGELVISDCVRTISLNFDIYPSYNKPVDSDKKLAELENLIHKAQTLESICTEMAEQLETIRETLTVDIAKYNEGKKYDIS